jgi:hypothetical protein
MTFRFQDFSAADADDDSLSRSASPRSDKAARASIWIGTVAFWIVVAGLIAARIAFLDPGKTASASTDSRAGIETSVALKN